MNLEIEKFADLEQLPSTFEEFGSCDGCVYWEHPKDFNEGRRDAASKARWMSHVLKDFGNCGFRAKVDGDVVGLIQYAPPRYYGNRFEDYPSGPPGKGSVFISCLYVRDPAQRGKGIASKLLDSALVELRARGFRRVEVLPRISTDDNPSGPLALYLKHGFRIVREGDDFPLVRLE